MRSLVLALGLCSISLGALFASACGSDASSSPSGGGGSGAVGGAQSGGTGGGTGGNAGASGGSAGAAGSGASGGSAGAAGSDASTPGPADHLLISEVGLQPGAAEFIEIYNPTSAEVDLTDYYVADNSAYYKFTSGPWNPTETAGTDFLAQFPADDTIAAGGVLVIASQNSSGNPTFEDEFGACPTYILNSTAAALSCGGGSVPAMLIPTNGGVGTADGARISNDREMIVLFRWDGSSATVQDVDYVTWGTQFDNNTRIDKSGETGYQADTSRDNQKSVSPGIAGDGGAPLAIERCSSSETGEKSTGGNGITGHDETSEDLGTTWQSQATPTPGVKNTCL
jgi:Lamin Tail Domain